MSDGAAAASCIAGAHPVDALVAGAVQRHTDTAVRHAAICATCIKCGRLCTTRIPHRILAMTIDTVGDLVRAARNGRNQKDFADLLGVKQSSVSRYERGKASPPISVIEHCMRLVHNQGEAPTAEQLAERIRVELADPSLIEARSALSRLVDAFVAEH